MIFGSVVSAALLVLRVAVECSRTGTCGATDGGSLKSTTRLMADDAACCCSESFRL